MLKRTVETALAAIALILLSPLMLAIAVLIKSGSTGAVVYRGSRVGLHGKPFSIFKFRSMVMNADAIGGPSTSNHDPRITDIGRFMRKFKLDELPQLINVLRGEMSLVGPRPQVPDYVARYSAEERAVLEVRPGITDWASIWNSDEGAVLAMHPDPDKAYDELIQPTKMQLQLLYVRQHSLWVDIKILAYTFLKLIRKSWVPPEIRPYPRPGVARVSNVPSFETVTELPGAAANAEQLAMLWARYGWAGAMARGKDVLEVACGSGIGLGHLAAHAKRVVGVDVDPKLVELCRQQYGRLIDVQQADAHSLPFPEAAFDIVILFEAIYYLDRADVFLHEARRVLRPGGLLLICSANCERRDFNASLYSKRYFSASALRDLLQQNGFRADVFAGFSVKPQSGGDQVRNWCRAVAVKMRLLPRTMKWKSRLKRLFFGKLQQLPPALGARPPAAEAIVPVDATQPQPGHKVLYAVGHRDTIDQRVAA